MERSGIDMLEEIIKRLENLEQRFNVLDQNIKVIVNTTNIADMVKKAVDTPLDGWARAIPVQKQNVENKIAEKRREMESNFSNFKFEPTDAAKMKHSVAKRVSMPKNIMVKGKMLANVNDKTIPLSKISVKIYDASDTLVKETRTNRAGHWMGQLAPGKYVALFEGELDGKKLVSQNRNFEVPEKLSPGQSFIEVV